MKIKRKYKSTIERKHRHREFYTKKHNLAMRILKQEKREIKKNPNLIKIIMKLRKNKKK